MLGNLKSSSAARVIGGLGRIASIAPAASATMGVGPGTLILWILRVSIRISRIWLYV